VKELALLWCGRELLEIISSFFLCSRNLGFLFAFPNFTDGFMRPSNSEMKQETNVLAIVMYLSYVALKWCMTSPSHINRLCSFTAVFRSGFQLKLQFVAMMASSRKCLLEDEIEQSLLGELTASDQSSCSDDDDSSGTADLTVVEVTGLECSDSESDDVQCATASSAPTASSATFTWGDMTNYVGQREQFVDNYGPQNETHCAKVFRMFF